MRTKLILLLGFVIFIPVLFTSCGKNDENNENNDKNDTDIIDSLPTVYTASVTDIRATYAKSGGYIGDDGGYSVTERGVVWSTGPNPNINDNKTSDGAGAGSFISHASDLTPETDYYLRAYATNNKGTAYGASHVFKTTMIYGKPCTGTPTVTDIDGNVYNTVLIGAQCWMKENLKTTTYKNGTPITNSKDASTWQNLMTGAYVWYNNDSSWNDSYGALYNWYATIDPNGLCPEGWHVPDYDDWKELTNHIGGTYSPNGSRLKSCRQVNSPLGDECNTTEHPRWGDGTYSYGTDNYGFSGLPGGYRGGSGLFISIGYKGYWWTSTENSMSWAYCILLDYNFSYVLVSDNNKQYGFSVRCLRD